MVGLAVRAAARRVASVALLVAASGCVNASLRPTTLQVGKSLNSDNSVGTLTTTFKPTDTIYASVLTSGSGAGTITARFSFGGRVVSEPKKDVRYRGDAATEFHMAYSAGFPAGEYLVEILVDDKPFETRKFRVEN